MISRDDSRNFYVFYFDLHFTRIRHTQSLSTHQRERGESHSFFNRAVEKKKQQHKIAVYIFWGCFQTGAISIDFSLGIDSSTVYYPTDILNNKFNFDSFLISHLFGLCCI